LREMTKAEYDQHVRAQYAATRIKKATAEHGAHRYREAIKSTTGGGFGSGLVQVFVTDIKRVDPPAPDAVPSASLPAPLPPETRAPRPPGDAQEDAAPFRVMAAQLRAGVVVVTAPYLFP